MTADDVRDLARDHWQPESMSAAAIGPDGDVIRAAIGGLSPGLAEA